MSVVIKSSEMSYKDPNSGNYVGINVLAEKKTSDQLSSIAAAGVSERSAIEAKGQTVISDIPASYDDLNNIIADSYDSTKTYSVGDYVRYYDGTHDKLYRCITDISIAEAWTSGHWVEVVMADEVNLVNNNLTSLVESGLVDFVTNSMSWAKGGITASSGASNSLTNRYRTEYLSKNDYLGFAIAENYWYSIFVYDNNQVYLGEYNGMNYIKSATPLTQQMLIGSIPDTCYIRLLIGRSDDATVSEPDKSALKILKTADTTLSVPGKAADAKATGDAIKWIESSIPEFSIDTSKVTSIEYYITSSNKWKAINISQALTRGSCIVIPPNSKKIKITCGVNGGICAFLSEFDPINKTSPDFSVEEPGCISIPEGIHEFEIAPDMKYLYYLKIDSSGNIFSPASIVFMFMDYFYTDELYPYEITDFAKGGIDYDGDGLDTTTPKRARTNNYHKICHNYLQMIDARHKFKVCYYDVNLKYLGCTSDWVRSAVAKETDFSGAQYFRLVFAYYQIEDTIPYDTFVTSPKLLLTDNPIEFDRYTVLTQDKPKNIGVLNCICRAKQISMIPYTTAAVMPNQDGDTAADTSVNGIPYSSVRVEGLFVPNCVSFDSFMTAVLNPNSYIYTRQLDTPNAKTYMGSVCSAMVSYSYGLPAVYTTHQLGDLEDIELVEDQSIYGLELGHMLLRKDSHIALCTGIWRDSYGRIKYVEITEAISPRVITHVFTPGSLKSRFLDHNFKVYRYKPIYAVDYTPSPWVQLLDEPQVVPTYNTNLAPRRGDKANWRIDEDVVIDVTDVAEFTSYKLYVGDTLMDTQVIPSGDVITLSGLGANNYKVCLTDGSSDSDFVYFAVVNAECTAENQGNGVAKVSFSCSANATPAWIAWCYTSGSDIYAAKFIDIISDTDRTNGYIMSTYKAGTYLFKVYVRTEYGDYSSEYTESVTIT